MHLRGKRIFLTWNGKWGTILDVPKYSPSMGEENVVEVLRQRRDVMELWSGVQGFAGDLKQRFDLKDYAVALELCLNTWMTQDICRLHFHIFLMSKKQLKCARNRGDLIFRGSVGFESSPKGMAKPRGKSCNFDMGEFYVMIPKIGGVFQFSTRKMYKDYQVIPQWVTRVLSSERVTEKDARILYRRCVATAKFNLDNLNFLTGLAKEEALTKLVETTQAALKALEKPALKLDDVDALVADHQELRHRYKFLVLEGPSRYGKSMYALSLAGRAKTLDLSCAGQLHPDLRQHDPFVHRAVLFDEAPVTMILAYKRHFQAPSTLLDCGLSSTNCHAYKVWLYQQLLIVTSNTWSEELNAVAASDREWIEANSLHKQINFKLWVDEPCGVLSPGRTRDLPADEDLAAFLEEDPQGPARVEEFEDEDVFGFDNGGFDQ